MTAILIDDHPLFSELLKTAIEGTGEFDNVILYESGDDFVYAKPVAVPDLIILDVRMPGMDGLKVVEFCRKNYPAGLKIIILSFIANVQIVKQAIRLGVNGYLSKSVPVEELLLGVREVISGNKYIAGSIRKQMIDNMFVGNEINFKLTDREMQVLEMVCKGYAFKEIAFELKISYHTVHYYYKNLLKKLKINKSRDLIVFAMLHGLYVPDV